ncbi:MAG: glycosyltransferase family 2 protein, partial [Patescibacteria group bacterium]
MDYLKIGKAGDLSGRDYKIYRGLEMLPAFLSWATLIILVALSYLKPIWVAYFIVAFDVYWLLLVAYLGIHLVVSYKKLKQNMRIDWEEKCRGLDLSKAGLRLESIDELAHLIIFPTYNESLDVIRPSFRAVVNDGYPTKNMIMVLAIEERGGHEAMERAKTIEQEFGKYFRNFLITIHPDGIEGEIKGKGANQAWAAREVKEKIIDKEGIDYDKIIVSVFDIDTIINRGYFYCLTHRFLTVEKPHQASYQPIPVYHNNIWEAPFFARVAASSNTFWQMMQQIRVEKLATYSSHSMSWKALVDIGFWSTKMVSEDSRIFWHCYLHYNGDYRVEPLYFSVSMDVCMDESIKKTMRNLYKQQRRWGWGVENVPYLIFNTMKNWDRIPKRDMLSKIFNQLYGFHSWATNALIIGVIGWLPMLLGGDAFN